MSSQLHVYPDDNHPMLLDVVPNVTIANRTSPTPAPLKKFSSRVLLTRLRTQRCTRWTVQQTDPKSVSRSTLKSQDLPFLQHLFLTCHRVPGWSLCPLLITTRSARHVHIRHSTSAPVANALLRGPSRAQARTHGHRVQATQATRSADHSLTATCLHRRVSSTSSQRHFIPNRSCR